MGGDTLSATSSLSVILSTQVCSTEDRLDSFWRINFILKKVVFCVYALQTSGVGSGRKVEWIPASVHSHSNGGQEPTRTSSHLRLCEKELELPGSEVSPASWKLFDLHIVL